MMIGAISTDRPEPYLILRFSDFEAAFAGMLAWESTLPRDVGSLFGVGTLPDTLRFTDQLRNNRTVRVLAGPAEQERIVYAFIDRRTIIITTSTTALSRLSSALTPGT
jgi:hypothetical protein